MMLVEIVEVLAGATGSGFLRFQASYFSASSPAFFRAVVRAS